MKKYWIVLLSLMFVAPSAFANTKFSLVGGINYGMDSVSASASIGSITISSSVKGGLGFGGGLLVQMGAVEIGGIFLSRTYTTTINSVSTSSSDTGVEIPVMARIGGGAATFGIGGFYDAGSSSDYGLTAGPRFGGNNGGIFFDARFNYGLKSGNSKNVLAMLGYAFGKGK